MVGKNYTHQILFKSMSLKSGKKKEKEIYNKRKKN